MNIRLAERGTGIECVGPWEDVLDVVRMVSERAGRVIVVINGPRASAIWAAKK